MNIYDIAKEVGVSIATVSRVINNKAHVKPATREKIERYLEQHNYTPSAIARGMMSKSLRSIAILTVDVRVPHYARTCFVIEQNCSVLGYNVVVCNTGGRLEESVNYVKSLSEKHIDGIVLVGSVFNKIGKDPRFAAHLKTIPVVMANGQLGLPNSHSVLVDDALGASLATEHLLERGHRAIRYVRDLDTDSAQIKADGFVAAMRKHGVDDPESLVVKTPYGIDGGRRAAAAIFSSHPETTAVVCGEDLTAVGVSKEALRSGRRVPDDLAVTGYNNSDYAVISSPELTSVDNKVEMAAMLSVQLLENLINGQGRYASMIIQPELVVREST